MSTFRAIIEEGNLARKIGRCEKTKVKLSKPFGKGKRKASNNRKLKLEKLGFHRSLSREHAAWDQLVAGNCLDFNCQK